MRLRVMMVESILELKDTIMMNSEDSLPVDMHQLASEVFGILLKESEDLSIYKALVAANIRDSAGLLDTDEATIKKILDALPKKSGTRNLVLAYLNLITYNNLVERHCEMDIENEADGNDESSKVDSGKTKPELEGNSIESGPIHPIDSNLPLNDAEVIQIRNKEVVNNPSILEDVNRSSDINTQHERGYSASNYFPTDAGKEDTQEIDNDEVMWTAPKAIKKGWFR